MLYEALAQPLLFRLDAEVAHSATLRALELLPALPSRLTNAPRTVFGVQFPGPVGLAAGMDKDGRALRAWPALGFGFIEVGTVTAHPQPGNDRPRLFRLRESGAIINRMGFNNRGAAALAERLRASATPPRRVEAGESGTGRKIPLGISLGKSKITPIEDATGDYVTSLRLVDGLGDYFAINVSSPNTPNLRTLQDADQLGTLLAALRSETATPILVKIAPDLTEDAIAQLIEVCLAHGVNGVIATNTTLSREGLTGADAQQAGGLSGRPLTLRARDVVAFIAKETGGTLPIIGVGGISSPDDALAMIDAGASLVQLYSALIFQGPRLIKQINKALG